MNILTLGPLLLRQDRAIIVLAERVLRPLVVIAPIEVEIESANLEVLPLGSASIWFQTSLTHVDTAPLPGGLSLPALDSALLVAPPEVYFPCTLRFISLFSMRSQDWLTAVRPPEMRMVSCVDLLLQALLELLVAVARVVVDHQHAPLLSTQACSRATLPAFPQPQLALPIVTPAVFVHSIRHALQWVPTSPAVGWTDRPRNGTLQRCAGGLPV